MVAARASVVSSYTVKQALVEETYRVLHDWDPAKNQRANLNQLRHSNALGLRSTSWLNDVAKILNRRLDLDGADRVVMELARAESDFAIWRPLLLWHMTRDEFMVRDFLINWLFPLHASGTWRVRTQAVDTYLEELHKRPDVDIKEAWSPETAKRVASGLLRLAVDFGLMKGTTTREFVSYHLPDEAFLYLLHAMIEAEPNAHRMLHSPDWRMYLMGPDDVQRELFRLHQLGRLRYEVAGSIAELRLPYPTAAEFARKELMP
jgi:hypothetical protein